MQLTHAQRPFVELVPAPDRDQGKVSSSSSTWADAPAASPFLPPVAAHRATVDREEELDDEDSTVALDFPRLQRFQARLPRLISSCGPATPTCAFVISFGCSKSVSTPCQSSVGLLQSSKWVVQTKLPSSTPADDDVIPQRQYIPAALVAAVLSTASNKKRRTSFS